MDAQPRGVLYLQTLFCGQINAKHRLQEESPAGGEHLFAVIRAFSTRFWLFRYMRRP